MRGLAGKSALVTGGASGLGSSIARRLVEEGASVLIADVNLEGSERLAVELGERAVAIEHDVGDEASWGRAIATARDRFGGLQLLVNNAATAVMKTCVDTTLEELERVIRVNQIGPFLGMKTAIPLIAQTGGGAIVNISSMNGHRATPGMAAYVGTKHALLGLTKNVAMEVAPLGIRVNAVCPGGMDTPATSSAFAGIDVDAIMKAKVPLGRLGDPAEVAAVVCFLLSDEASYVTGSDWGADGGVICGVTIP